MIPVIPLPVNAGAVEVSKWLLEARGRWDRPPSADDAAAPALSERGQQFLSVPSGKIYVLPSLCDLSDGADQTLLDALSLQARAQNHAYLTALTLSGQWLPGGDPTRLYRVGVLVTSAGICYGVAGKTSEPNETGVDAYHRWWRVPVMSQGESETVLVLLGSDVLYLASGLNTVTERLADWIIVLGDAYPSMDQAAVGLLEMAIESGWSRGTILVPAGMNAGTVPWPAMDWSPEALPVIDADRRRLELIRQHALWLPDRVFQRRREVWALTEGVQSRVVMPVSAAGQIPELRDWPFAPILA